MIKVTSLEKFNTVLGDTFVIDEVDGLKNGERISIDGDIYVIKRILMNTKPSGKLALVVE